MPASYAESLENITELAREMSKGERPGRNEATTRLQLIDRLLFDCLGWDRSQCVAEDNFQGSYTDYSLGKPYVNLIVEAKKEGISFDLPSGFDGVTYRIKRFRREAPDVYEAIKQAMSYCQSRGVPFGAVCNGRQIIAFLASRTDGIPPMQGKALVLGSMQMMMEHFLILWDCLSFAGIESRGLPLKLQETGRRLPPDKLSLRIPNFPRYQSRNPIQSNLRSFGDLIIEDVGRLPENEEEFLRECYAESGALSQYALVSKSILQSKYSQEFEESLAGPSLISATKRGGDPKITSEMLAQSATRRPVLLIGDVGVGKTMFIRHFISVEAADLLQEAIVLYLDLGIKPTLQSDLDEYLQEEITRQLLKDYEIDISDRNFVHAVYHGELSRFERGIYGGLRNTDRSEYDRQRIRFLEEKIGSSQEHLRQCLEHISKGQNRQIVIFLDNVDQRVDEFQQQAFLIGQSMAELWPALVFVALRPETYHRSRQDGTLSAYHAKAFTISPPRVDRVIHRRLRYAIQLLGSGTIGQSLEGIDLNVDLRDLSDFLEIVDFSFQNNLELVEFVDNVCGGNIRLALDFVRVFVGSGHANTVKMLNIYRETGSYNVALHEFLRAIIYGDYRDYDPSFSEIINLFDISGDDGREHFLAPIILAYLGSDARAFRNSGYIAAENIHRYIQGIGFQPVQIISALNRLLNKKLIETETKDPLSDRIESTDLYYRITTIGSYYYQKMVGKFPYIDAVVVDTPIVERTFRETISDQGAILSRLERANKFRQYLDSQWDKIESVAEIFDWRSFSMQLSEEMAFIRRQIQRQMEETSVRKAGSG